MTDFADVLAAQSRLAGRIKKSPLVRSHLLEQWLSERLPQSQRHTIWFKAECLQHTGAFKIRGATNFIAKLAEQGQLPQRFVANSSGNHAQAVAYAASQFNRPATIFAAQNISSIKAAATRSYGAELKLFPTRPEADEAVRIASQSPDTTWIPPFNHPDIIAGQGTAVAESLQELDDIDAVFAPCGGGGLLSGSLIATRALAPHADVIGAEPLAANDAAESLRTGSIQSLSSPAKTLADGAATPSIGEHTFPFLQQLDGFYEINEQDITYWSQWLHHLLKLHIEPTCCMSMQAVAEYLAKQDEPKRVLVVLSGGNISAQTMATLFQDDHLSEPPHIEMLNR
jgi:threonine dehydratase